MECNNKPNEINLILVQLFSHLEPSDSALKTRCHGLNVKIERISKLIYFLVVKLTLLGVLLPALFITLINYFIYDLKDESYYLTFPIAYVGSSIHIFVGLLSLNLESKHELFLR